MMQELDLVKFLTNKNLSTMGCKENTDVNKKEGLRFNKGKNRLGLIPPFTLKEVGKVFTFGAEKYGATNYRKGMPWSKCIDSLDRHWNDYKSREDFDNESGLYHLAHVIANASFLLEYYKIAPQFDDRMDGDRVFPKIGLDIDEVICDWIPAWIEKHELEVPTAWFFDRQILQRFKEMEDAGTLNQFYLDLKPRINPCDIPFEPHCYVTSRPIPTEITEQWLHIHGFPARPVITVKVGESKVNALKEAGVELFVDDRYDNFLELNQAGICTFLMDAEHNKRYNVGYKRIYSLKELKF